MNEENKKWATVEKSRFTTENGIAKKNRAAGRGAEKKRRSTQDCKMNKSANG